MAAAKTIEQKLEDALERNKVLIHFNTELEKQIKELKELVVKSVSRVKASLFDLNEKCKIKS